MAAEKKIVALMQLMNRNVSTLEDKANLSINDSESMSTLSRLERDIVLADPEGINEELQSLSDRNNAIVVMQILEKDLQSIGIECSWTRNANGSLSLPADELTDAVLAKIKEAKQELR